MPRASLSSMPSMPSMPSVDSEVHPPTIRRATAAVSAVASTPAKAATRRRLKIEMPKPPNASAAT